MSHLSSAVVHLTMCAGDRNISTGSGVFYRKDDKYYIVTAWHNVTGRHTETLGYLDEDNLSVPDSITLTFKHFIQDICFNQSISVPLYDDDKALFYVHPDNWPRIDVVAIPFDPFAEHTLTGYMDGQKMRFQIPLSDGTATPPISTIQDHLVPANLAERWMAAADVTEEVFIPSYPHNITDYDHNPVWKRATLASNPNMGWNDERKYLIDSASSSGMSGASVFYYNAKGSVDIYGSKFHQGKPAVIHAGIYVGRIGVIDKADPQVGTVWHASVVDEIIDGKTYDFLPHEVEMREADIEVAIKNSLKKSNKEGLQNVLNETKNARYYVRNDVMKEIKGRANPNELIKQILAVAATYDGPLVEGEE